MLPDFIMSSFLLSKTDICSKLFFFDHNVRYGNSVTFRIGVVLESSQYLDNHAPQRYNFLLNASQLIQLVDNIIAE